MHRAVAVVGEALIDIVIAPDGETVEKVGGSPANVAVGLARLGHEVRLATHIGTDQRGNDIADLLAAEGVELLPSSRTAARTPTASAHLDTAGVASYEFDLRWELAPDSVDLTAVGHLHTGSIAATFEPGAEQVLRLLQQRRPGGTISYDPNARPTLMGDPDAARERIEQLIRLSDVVKASSEDIEWLYPGTPIADVLQRWAGFGPSICAATQGGEEALVQVAGSLHHLPARPTRVADTVGAGDSFMSGMVSGLLDAGLLGGTAERARLQQAGFDDIAAAVTRALACAAITVSRPGSDPPRRTELPPLA